MGQVVFYDDDQKVKEAIENLVHEEEDDRPVPVYTVNRILSILLQFQQIPSYQLKEYKDNACREIQEHLLGFSRKGSKCSVKRPDEFFSKICEKASLLLSPPDFLNSKGSVVETHDSDLGLEKEDYPPRAIPYQFQKKWLTNIGILLPNSDAVKKILPYLLTCYTNTVFENHLDCFDDYPSIGWQELFEEFAEGPIKERKNEGGYNRSKNARSLANRFILPSKGINAAFFCNRSDFFFEGSGTSTYSTMDVSFAKDGLKRNGIIDEKRACMESWELYRRFASFCEACANESEVNISLSMALFADIWNIGDFNSVKEHPEIYLDDFGKMLPQYSWENIQSDNLRNLILTLTKKHAIYELDTTIDIHEIAYLSRIDFRESLSKKAFSKM